MNEAPMSMYAWKNLKFFEDKAVIESGVKSRL